MEPNEYQNLANRTAKDMGSPFENTMHAQLGITTEAGEFADTVKKHWIYGQSVDFDNIKEELGDLLWYIALAASANGFTLEEIMIQNIEKLNKRYPEKYSDFHAKQRLDKQHGTIQGS